MNTLAPSELVLNSKGNVYHLDLAPNEISDKIILVGDQNRVAKISKHFDKIEIRRSSREFTTHTGWFQGKRITAMSSGIGCDNIDIVINELDALVNVDLKERKIKSKHFSLDIVRLGTCGSLHAEAHVDSFITSTHGLGLDGLLHFYQHSNNSEEKSLLEEINSQLNWKAPLPALYLKTSNRELLDRIGFDMHRGITATANGFYGPQGRSIRLKNYRSDINDLMTDFRFDNLKIMNFEMETSALYGLSKELGHRALTVCTVVANRANKTFAKNQDGVESLIKTVLDRI